ncbi:hypothetical protein C8R47DRAFT_745436 [Mycena vitilis]|nr:hypothetical protein C8R47DRAFT_745436 [Mycena vitilis]
MPLKPHFRNASLALFTVLFRVPQGSRSTCFLPPAVPGDRLLLNIRTLCSEPRVFCLSVTRLENNGSQRERM